MRYAQGSFWSTSNISFSQTKSTRYVCLAIGEIRVAGWTPQLLIICRMKLSSITIRSVITLARHERDQSRVAAMWFGSGMRGSFCWAVWDNERKSDVSSSAICDGRDVFVLFVGTGPRMEAGMRFLEWFRVQVFVMQWCFGVRSTVGFACLFIFEVGLLFRLDLVWHGVGRMALFSLFGLGFRDRIFGVALTVTWRGWCSASAWVWVATWLAACEGTKGMLE